MTTEHKQEIAEKCRRSILLSEWVQNLYPSSPAARAGLTDLILSAINEATAELEKESAEKSDNYRQQSEWCERLVKELNAYKLRAEQWELQYTELLKEVEELRANYAKLDSAAYEMMAKYQSEMIMMFGHAKDCDCSRCFPYHEFLRIRTAIDAAQDTLKHPPAKEDKL